MFCIDTSFGFYLTEVFETLQARICCTLKIIILPCLIKKKDGWIERRVGGRKGRRKERRKEGINKSQLLEIHNQRKLNT